MVSIFKRGEKSHSAAEPNAPNENLGTSFAIEGVEDILKENKINVSEGRDAGELTSTFDRKVISKVIVFLAVACSMFHLYTAGFGVLPTQLQRAWHLTFILSLIFLVYPSKHKPLRYLDYVLCILGLVMGLYIIITYNTLMFRVGAPNQTDILFGCILVFMVLEATRRTSGWALVIVSAIALLYVGFGHLLSGMFAHKQYTLVRLVNTFYVGGEGLFGITMGVAATYIVTFVIFGAFLSASGGTKVFIDLAFALAGRFRGGPAKIAVISSALMGTINGTAVANVVTTGTFSIPLMKKLGYKPETAGAVEAVASSGGAIMPPVMGAGAFVMAEMTGIPYSKIIIAAIIPAIIYYVAVFLSVDFEACKLGLRGVPKDELPPFMPVLKKSMSFFMPLIVLIVLICVIKLSVLRSAFYAICSIVALNVLFGGENRMRPRDYLKALVDGAKGTLLVSCACCCVGLVVGTISLTGLGLMLTSFLLAVAGNMLLGALLVTMVITIIMGMALPATPAYIIVSVIAAPAMVNFGVPLLAAHMFVYYFSVFAPITPPVCIASFAAASLAGAPPLKTGFVGMRLAIAGFLCPFMLVYSPALLMNGAVSDILLSSLSALVGTLGFAAFAIGWLKDNLTVLSRIMCLVGGALMLLQGLVTDAIGLVLLVIVALIPKTVRLFKQPSQLTAEVKSAV